MSRCHALLMLLAVILISGNAAYAQIPTWLTISPEIVRKPPADPSCYTISVPDGAFMTLDVEVVMPWGETSVFYSWVTLDWNGEALICIGPETDSGTYTFTGIRNAEYPWMWFTPVWAPLTVEGIKPVITALGTGCETWDCVWIIGTNFQPDSRVILYSADWTSYEIYYGPAWQWEPSFVMTSDNQWLAFRVANPDLRDSLAWSGVRVLVLNIDGEVSTWESIDPPVPQIYSISSTCPDFYCIELAGAFPRSASVDFRVPGQSDVLVGAYTDLVVTDSVITLRLSPNVRQQFDLTGLDVWVVNPVLPNWSSGHYIPPIDRSITGWIDNLVPSAGQYFLSGWACTKTFPGSIDVHVYAGGPAGEGGTFAFSGTANSVSEPAVAEACNAVGSNYRFFLPIPPAVAMQFAGQSLHVYGISPLGLPNLPLGNSGTFSVPVLDYSVTGVIGGVVSQGSSYFLHGWACAKNHPGSIDVHVYVGGPAGAGGTFAFAGTANVASEPAIAEACSSTGTSYRFWMEFPADVLSMHLGKRIYAYGISPFGLASGLLSDSGRYTVPGTLNLSLREFIYLGDRLIAVEAH